MLRISHALTILPEDLAVTLARKMATIVAALTLSVFSTSAKSQIVDHQIPLNYNFHGMAHTSEAAVSAGNGNADIIDYRAIADRGLLWDSSDRNAIGSQPLLGWTGVSYGLFSPLGYVNTTATNASTHGLDIVHLGSRVWDRGFETSANAGTSTGSAPAWAPLVDVTALSGDGATVTATTAAPHGLTVGSVVNIVGANPVGYAGTHTVTGVPDATHFTYANTTTGASTGSIFCNSTSTPIVTTLSGNGTNVTATTVTPHGFAVGNTVNISGSSVAGYNGQYVLIAPTSGTTFTFANATTGATSGTQILAATCDHLSDQVTVLATPITVDSATEIGVLHMISNSGGHYDCVLTFNNGVTDTHVTARLGGNDWFGASTDAAVVSPFVVSQRRIQHANTESVVSLNGSGTTVTATTSVAHGFATGQQVIITGASPSSFNGSFNLVSVPSPTEFTYTNSTPGSATGTITARQVWNSFRGVQNNDTASLPTFDQFLAASQPGGTGNTNGPGGGPALNVTESIISVARIIAAGTNVAGQNLTRITFRNPRWPVTTITALTGDGTTATATVASNSGYIVGMPIRITGVNDAGFNGEYVITALNGTNQFRFANSTVAATTTAQRYANTVPVSAIAASTPSAGFVQATTTVAHGFVVGQQVTISGVLTEGYNGIYTVATIPSSTTFTFLNATTGTNTATRQVSRIGVGRGYSIYAVTARTGSPAHANCAAPLPISAGDTVIPAADMAHAPLGATPTACGGGNDTNPLWFSYVATGNNLVEARTCGSTVDTTIAVYTLCGGVAVACNDNGCLLQSRVQWNATNGTTYLIRVAGKDNAAGGFTLHIDDPAHIDITMPIQFNWNGICHGDAERTLPTGNSTTPPIVGSIHENRADLNGFRAIADRGLLLDGSSGTLNQGNSGGLAGTQGMVYTFYGEPLQADMVHLGNRDVVANGARMFSFPGTLWPSQATPPSSGSISNNGLVPLWLDTVDHTGPQTSSMTSLNAVMGANTKIGLLYHASDVNPAHDPPQASFDVRLSFSDNPDIVVTVKATDWFWNNTGVMPPPTPTQGLEVQTVLRTFRATQNTDRGDDVGAAESGGWLKVDEAIISTSSLIDSGLGDMTGKHLTAITFENPIAGSGTPAQATTNSAFGIYSAVLRDPQSFNLNFGPTGVGTVTPNQLIAGSTGKMVVTVSRGSGTPNNITSVVVDGTSVGLANNLQLNDSGTNGDVTPNDNKWSRNVSFPVNTSPGAFSLPFLVTDAQSRTDDGNIIFTIITPPGGVTPGSVVVGSEPKFTVTLSSGGTPAPGIASVTLDGSQFGLSNTLALNDAGNNGDTTANDGIYSRDARVALGTGAGAYVVPFTVTDTLANTFNGNMPELTINQPTAAVSPPQAFEGITCKFTVNLVLNGLKSTNITSVTADLSPINLNNATALNDSGNNGDTAANDGIWSVDFVVPAGAPTGQTQLQFAVLDSLAEGASGFANFNVSVLNDLGVLGTGLTTFNSFQNPGDVHWYRFTLASNQGVNDFLDIDTEETLWTGTNDTHVALYDSSGNLFLNGATPAIDDDDGTNNLSQLTFGNSTVPRSPPGNGLAYNGRDGILNTGVYYLAVTGFSATFNNGFNVTTTSTQSGSTVVRLALGTVPAGGPPATFIDLGVLGQTPVTNTQTLSSGGVVWFKFILDTPVDGATPAPREYFDIDSEGSSIFDTMIALYRDDGSGTLVTSDDNDGSGNYSQLTYGRGTRDPVFDSQPYNGRDGLTLAAGTYYLAVTEFAATFGNNFVVFFNTGTSTGDVTVNLRRGVQSLIVCGPINNPANNHDYYLLEAGLTGTDAEAYAVNTLGGHLVTLNDNDENEWVRSNVLLCNGAADRRAFIGLNDSAVEGTHEWFNGEPVSYTNWSGGEPNNGNGTGEEDYSEMLGNGLWNDIPATATATRFALVEVGISPIGDMDCSGVVDAADVQAFVLALIDPSGYGIQYPGCSILNGDMNTDTLVNGRDIDPFTQLVIP